MILHDWVCLAHGNFESELGVCPYGCGEKMVRKIFLKAPAYHAGRTANIDRTLQGLADDHGLTDMNNQNGTSSVFRHDPGMDRQANAMQEAMMRGQTFSSGMGQGANAIQQTLQSGGFQADNALSSVAPLIQKPRPIVEASWDGKN